jgi:anti-sigma factor RsiW
MDLELSAYLDGELNARARDAVETHLRDCAECTALLAELSSVVTSARTLEDRGPDTDLWPGIARRIGAAPDHETPLPMRSSIPFRAIARQFSFSLPQLVAAAVFVALLSGGVVWWALRAPNPADGRADKLVATPTGSADASTADFEIHHYDQAVAELQQALNQNRSRLDPETVRTVESNLAVIDAAIVQARRALVADPANPYLSGHLAEQMRRKIRVLQRTANAVTAEYGGSS